MAEIINIGDKESSGVKQNLLKSLRDWFFSLDKIVRLSVVFVLLMALVAAVVGGTYLNLRSQAGGMGEIKEVWISPGKIDTIVTNTAGVALSAAAVDYNTKSYSEGVFFDWGMSSTNAVGTLKEVKGNLAKFYPLKVGCGELHVNVPSVGKVVTKSIPVVVRDEKGNAPSGCSTQNVNIFGKALDLSSGNAYLELLNSGDYQSGGLQTYLNKYFTYEAYVNYQSNSANMEYPIISKSFNLSKGEALPFNLTISPDGTVKFIYSVQYNGRWAPTEINSKTKIVPGQWAHIAVVYNNIKQQDGYQKLRLFINGKLEAEKDQIGEITGGSTGNIIIGKSAGNIYFKGLLDEIRITAKAMYTTNFTPPDRPMFLEPQSLALFYFDKSSIEPYGWSSGVKGFGTYSFVDSNIKPATNNSYSLTPYPQQKVTMPVSTPNSGYAVYALLKDSKGAVVTNQSEFQYIWTKDDPGNALSNLSPFTGCANGITEPCPSDHASFAGLKAGSATIKVTVTQKSTNTIVANLYFYVTVTPTPTPTSAIKTTSLDCPATVNYINSQGTWIKIALKDNAGKFIANKNITITKSSTSSAYPLISPTSGLTNSNGVLSSNLWLPLGFNGSGKNVLNVKFAGDSIYSSSTCKITANYDSAKSDRGALYCPYGSTTKLCGNAYCDNNSLNYANYGIKDGYCTFNTWKCNGTACGAAYKEYWSPKCDDKTVASKCAVPAPSSAKCVISSTNTYVLSWSSIPQATYRIYKGSSLVASTSNISYDTKSRAAFGITPPTYIIKSYAASRQSVSGRSVICPRPPAGGKIIIPTNIPAI